MKVMDIVQLKIKLFIFLRIIKTYTVTLLGGLAKVGHLQSIYINSKSDSHFILPDKLFTEHDCFKIGRSDIAQLITVGFNY